MYVINNYIHSSYVIANKYNCINKNTKLGIEIISFLNYFD